MNTVKVYQLKNLSRTQFRRLRDAQLEAAQVWNCCMQTHKAARHCTPCLEASPVLRDESVTNHTEVVYTNLKLWVL